MLHPLRRRALIVAGLAFAGALALPSTASAADPEVRLDVDRTKARIGEEMIVKLRVSGSSRVATPEIPEAWAEAFDVVSTAHQQSTTKKIVNGQGVRMVTRIVQAVIVPKKVGRHTLGFRVEIDGETLASNTAQIEVVGADAELASDPNGPPEILGPVFPWASVDRTEVYVGQQVTYALDIYEQRTVFSVHLRTPPSFKDFFSEELPTGEPRLAVVEGQRFRVEPGLRRALFPQKAGTLTIGAAELTIGMRQRTRSEPLDIVVKPLPVEGRPPAFSPNNVGRYTIAASVDRTEVTPGEPFTLKVTLEGTGNIAVVDPGDWPRVDGLRRYDPKVETTKRVGEPLGGERTYTFLMIPERPGPVTIPAQVFSFFDPQTERYETVRSEPITIEVGPGEAIASADESAEASGDEAEVIEEQLAAVIAEPALPRNAARERWLTPQRWIYGMLGVPLTVLTMAAGGALWRRFGPDEALRAKTRERARRRARIEQARAAIESGQGFHANLAALLHEIAVVRAGTEAIGVPRPELMRLLEARGVTLADREQLRGLLERCDAARFGAMQGSAAEREALFDEAVALIRGSSLGKGVV